MIEYRNVHPFDLLAPAPGPAEPTGAAPSMRVAISGTVGPPDTLPSQFLLAGALLVALRIGFLVRRIRRCHCSTRSGAGAWAQAREPAR